MGFSSLYIEALKKKTKEVDALVKDTLEELNRAWSLGVIEWALARSSGALEKKQALEQRIGEEMLNKDVIGLRSDLKEYKAFMLELAEQFKTQKGAS